MSPSPSDSFRHWTAVAVLLFSATLQAETQAVATLRCHAPEPIDPGRVAYELFLQNPAAHLVHVKMKLPPGAGERQVQLPVWNALYQVRDFAQYVREVRASDPRCNPVLVRKLDKATWRVGHAAQGAVVEYDVYADEPGPFGAQFNSRHAFFNFAELLMYPVGGRNLPIQVAFELLPEGWKIATPLLAFEAAATGVAPSVSRLAFRVDNYDRLVDSPVEIGRFEQASFEEGGASYGVVIDGDPADYNLEAIVSMLRKVVAAETDWMQDRPFEHYTFIYHLPRGPAAGGMEHAYSTAIDANASRVKEDPLVLAGVSAHEFFHLWNVKRIRPQSLQPIDYTKENFTRALWFAEGVNSTVSELMLVRAGLLDEQKYLRRLAQQIRALQSRPAHATQSVEESSLDTWFDKYPYYRRPERSISYYNKGEILGVLLDLQLREVSRGAKSLRDLFRYLNREYAKQGRYYADSAGIREAAEKVSGADFGGFFDRYVGGTSEIPYNQFLNTVGLELRQRTVAAASAGFTATTNFSATPVVSEVEPHSEAEAAGLRPGDVIQEINGHLPARDVKMQIAAMKPGETIRLRVSNRQESRELHINLVATRETDYQIVELDHATPEQRVRRAAWIRGESQPPAEAAGQ